MKLEEVAGFGVWAASAVAVAGFTWEAYSQEWKGFPGISQSFGGGAQVPGAVGAAAQAGAAAAGTFAQGFATNPTNPAAGVGTNAVAQAIHKPSPLGTAILTNPVTAGAVYGTKALLKAIFGGPNAPIPTTNQPSRQDKRLLRTAIRTRNSKRVADTVDQLYNLQMSRGWTQAEFQNWLSHQPYFPSLLQILD